MTEHKVSERVLETIRRLLALANDPATPANEREQALDEANRRMARHAIDMAVLDASRTLGEKRKPTQKVISLYDVQYEWYHSFQVVILNICETNRCRYAFHDRSITVVGMQDDVDWVEMLWLSVFFQFSSKIQPTWEPKLSVEENIYNFKNAGFKWKDIWEAGYRKLGSMPDGERNFIPGKCKYMITGYKKFCKDAGTEPIGTQTFAAYRLTFTNHFTFEVNRRLEEMRAANKEQEDSIPGSAVALRDTSVDVEAEFYRLFPSLSPEAKQKRRDLQAKEQSDAEAADAAYLASLPQAARAAELRRRAKEEAAAARRSDTYYRNAARRRTYDAAGASAGLAAGRSVDLTRNGKSATSGSRTEIN
jgi:hypothetical protein